jgi:hypothetical protein
MNIVGTPLNIINNTVIPKNIKTINPAKNHRKDIILTGMSL